MLKGTINTAGIDGKFDLILANINKNVLLEEMDAYADHLKTGGMIILSGFYVNDEADIEAKAVAHGFQYFKRSERNDWSSLIFEKN